MSNVACLELPHPLQLCSINTEYTDHAEPCSTWDKTTEVIMTPHHRTIGLLCAVLALPLVSHAASTATTLTSSITVGSLQRQFVAYIPANLAPNAPLVLALHGSGGTGETMRKYTANSFERLADQYGLIVVYPDGYDKNWNDCRKAATYTARQLNIDDIGFMRGLIQHFQASHQIDPKHVYVMGYSSGAQMAFRVGIEAPYMVAGIGAVSASLPTADNNACASPSVAVPTVIINGTSDPMNPYDGGTVALYGLFGSRGTVLSTDQTVQTYLKLANIQAPPVVTTLSRAVGLDRTWTQRNVWPSVYGKPVALYTVWNGGHSIPQASYTFPVVLGSTEKDIDTATEMWRFWQMTP